MAESQEGFPSYPFFEGVCACVCIFGLYVVLFGLSFQWLNQKLGHAILSWPLVIESLTLAHSHS